MPRWTTILVVAGWGFVAGLATAALLTRKPQKLVVDVESKLVEAAAERDRAITSLREESTKLAAVSHERDRALEIGAEQKVKLASLTAEVEEVKLARAKAQSGESNLVQAPTPSAEAKEVAASADGSISGAPILEPPADLSDLDPLATTTEFSLGSERLRVEIKSVVVYLPANRDYVPPNRDPALYGFAPRFIGGFLFHSLVGADEEIQFEKAGFYRIDGKAERITFRSGNTTIMELAGTSGVGFEFKQAGSVDLFIDLAGRSFKIPIRVIRVDICVGDEAATVVEKLGLPDEDMEVFVAWPNTKTVDTVAYGPSASENIIIAHHWRYRKWPGLVLSIVSDRVHEVASMRPRE